MDILSLNDLYQIAMIVIAISGGAFALGYYIGKNARK